MKEETQEPDTLLPKVQVHGPAVDFSFQFNTAKEHEKVENTIFDYLCEISKKFYKKKDDRGGVLIVLGEFDKSKEYVISGMRQIGKNPIQRYLNITHQKHKNDIVSMMSKNYDGAFVVNKNGQILGVGIYLTVENPSLDIPDGSGTRHITAASFSTRDDVQSVFTLSEETCAVRIWKNGVFTEQFHPDDTSQEGM